MGQKLFTTGSNYDRVNEHSLTSPFSPEWMSLVNIQAMSLTQVIQTLYDTDPDSDTLTVTAIGTGSDEGNGTPGVVGGTTGGDLWYFNNKFKWILYLCCCRQQYTKCTMMQEIVIVTEHFQSHSFRWTR